MTISPATPPPGAQDLLGRTVLHLLNARPSGRRVTGGAAPKSSPPLKVFILALTDAQVPDPLSRVRFTGWRYLIDDDGIPAVADIRPDGGGSPQFSNLTRGPFAKGLKLAAEQATTSYGMSAVQFEARVLEIPSIYSASLWLHGDHDVFFEYLEPNGQVPSSIGEDPNYLSRIRAVARDKAARSPSATTASP